MSQKAEKPEDLSDDYLSEHIVNMLHQIIVHHTLYFMEVWDQFGMEKALEIMDDIWKNSYQTQMRRISKTLGFEMGRLQICHENENLS